MRQIVKREGKYMDELVQEGRICDGTLIHGINGKKYTIYNSIIVNDGYLYMVKDMSDIGYWLRRDEFAVGYDKKPKVESRLENGTRIKETKTGYEYQFGVVEKTQPIIEEKLSVKNDETGLLIFDKGEKIGAIRANHHLREGAIMEVLKVQFDDRYVQVLHLLDMDYGMVIPEDIATLLCDSLNTIQDDLTITKDVSHACKEKED